jgi:hypothetical protein
MKTDLTIGGIYEATRLLNPKRFPMQDEPPRFKILDIFTEDGTVLVETEDGVKQIESASFVEFYCTKV